MADTEFRIMTVVDPSGAEAGLRRVDKSIDRTQEKGVALGATLKNALALVGIGIGIRALIQLEDEYDTINDRLRSVTQSTGELNAVWEELTRTSKDTFTSLSGNVETFTRFARVQDTLQLSTRQLVDLTRVLALAQHVSGENADETRGAMNRLVVAMTSGAIEAGEMTFILRGLPAIATLLARKLGTTQQGLIIMGQEGSLSIGKITGALLASRNELEGLNSKDLPTLKERLDEIRTVFLGLLNSIAVPGEAAVAALQEISEQEPQTGLEALGQAFAPVSLKLLQFFGRYNQEMADILAAQKAQAEAEAAIAGRTDERADAAKKLKDVLDRTPAPPTEDPARVSAIREITIALDDQIRVQQAALFGGELAAKLAATQNDLSKKRFVLTGEETAALRAKLEVEQRLNDAGKLREKLLAPEKDLARLRAAADLLRDRIASEQALQRVETERLRIRLQQIDAEKDELKVEAPGTARVFPGPDTAKLEELNLLLRRTNEEELRAMASTEALANSFSVNLKVGLVDGIRSITSVGEALQSGLANAFRASEDAMVSFIRTGEINFENFANAILDDIARVLVRLLVLQGIEAIGGGSVGGLIGSIIGRRQHGGPVNEGLPYVVGERGPELFVPSTGGQVVPSGGAGILPAPQVKVAIVNVTDPREVESALSSGTLDRAIVNVLTRNRGQVRGILA